MVEEARLEDTGAGLAPASDGWFVVNVADAAWLTNEAFGAACIFESDATGFDVGFTLGVVWPGRPSALYHRESNQEDFLVLSGECLLLVEGEERPLKAWDFVHCPPETEHIFVGAGHGPCVIFMTGSRANEHRVVYPRSELALRHGAGVETEAHSGAEAYVPFPKWKPERPDFNGLPWAEPS
ncbi:MAG: hypothetical protein QOG81_385 [Gaiellaceae bacterium]|jgi:uncharacterized cupin superfamily protein|nr:hypothetical protein [Gaiellaceae bacterium]